MPPRDKDLVITEDSPGTVDQLAKGSDYYRGMSHRLFDGRHCLFVVDAVAFRLQVDTAHDGNCSSALLAWPRRGSARVVVAMKVTASNSLIGEVVWKENPIFRMAPILTRRGCPASKSALSLLGDSLLAW